jgi:HEAT repeat protein
MLRVPDSAGGKKGKCPKCGQEIQIPAATEPPHAETRRPAEAAPPSGDGGRPWPKAADAPEAAVRTSPPVQAGARPAEKPVRKQAAMLVVGLAGIALAVGIIVMQLLPRSDSTGRPGGAPWSDVASPPAQPVPRPIVNLPPDRDIPAPPKSPHEMKIAAAKAIRSSDPAERAKALEYLKSHRPQAEDFLGSLGYLFGQMSTADEERVEIMNVMAVVGPASKTELRFILMGMDSANKDVAKAAESAFDKIPMDLEVGYRVMKFIQENKGYDQALYNRIGDRLLTLGLGLGDGRIVSRLRGVLDSEGHVSKNRLGMRLANALGAGAWPAMPEITAMVVDPNCPQDLKADANSFVNKYAVEVMPHLIEMIEDSSERKEYTPVFGRIGKPAIEALVRSAGSQKNVKKFDGITEVLVAVGKRGRAAVPVLLPRILQADEDGSHTCSGHAYWAIEHLGIDPEHAPALAAMLVDPARPKDLDDNLALLCDDVLPPLWPGLAGAVPHLRKGLKNGNYRIVNSCIKALKAAGPAAREALPDMADMLSSEDVEWDTKKLILETIGAAGPDAVDLAPKLLVMLKEPFAYGPATDAIARMGPKVIPQLCKALKTDESGANAAVALGKMGPAAKPASGDLLKALRGNDWTTAARAAEALGLIGDDSTSVVSALTAALANEYKEIATSAAFALGRLGPKARSAVPALKKILQSQPPRNDAVAAAAALVKLGQKDLGMTFLKSQLKPDPRGWGNDKEALNALAYLGPDGADAVDDIVAVLINHFGSARTEAVEALAAMGPAARPALPALRQARMDKKEFAAVLAKILGDNTQSVDDLLAQLKGLDAFKRRLAAFALSDRPADDAAKVVPALYEGLGDADESVRTGCLYAIMRIDPDAESKLPEKAAAIGPIIGKAVGRMDLEGYVKWTHFVGRLRPPALASIRDLHDAVFSKNGVAAMALGDALVDMGPDAVAPFMQARRARLDESLYSKWLCQPMVRRGKPAVPLLIALLKHRHQDLERILDALLWIGPDGAGLIDDLAPLVGDSDDHLAVRAADVLGNIGSDNDRAIAELGKALDNENAGVRAAAALALGKIGSRQKVGKYVPKIRKLLYSDEPREACSAAGALLALGSGENCLDVLKNGFEGGGSKYAAEACQAAGPAAEPLLSDLTAALKKVSDSDYRDQGIRLILAMCRVCKDDDKLAAALTDRFNRTRNVNEMFLIIREIKGRVPMCEAAKQLLTKASESKEKTVAEAAAEALKAGEQ